MKGQGETNLRGDELGWQFFLLDLPKWGSVAVAKVASKFLEFAEAAAARPSF